MQITLNNIKYNNTDKSKKSKEAKIKDEVLFVFSVNYKNYLLFFKFLGNMENERDFSTPTTASKTDCSEQWNITRHIALNVKMVLVLFLSLVCDCVYRNPKQVK